MSLERMLRSAIVDAVAALKRAPHSDEENGCTTCCVIEDLEQVLRESRNTRHEGQSNAS